MSGMQTGRQPVQPTGTGPHGGRSWVRRAEGDRRASARLRLLEGEGVIVLSDRRAPGMRVGITRIAVSSAGVFVIDAKHGKGLVHTRRSGPISNLGPDELHVGRKDYTACVDQVGQHVEAVRAALESVPGGTEIPVHAMLCLTRAEWGFASPVEIRDVCVAWPQLIAGRVRVPGSVDSPTVQQVSVTIAEHLPTA